MVSRISNSWRARRLSIVGEPVPFASAAAFAARRCCLLFATATLLHGTAGAQRARILERALTDELAVGLAEDGAVRVDDGRLDRQHVAATLDDATAKLQRCVYR